MKKDKLFIKFCKERNIKESTIVGYESALEQFTKFNKQTLTELINEASTEEENRIPLKKRKLKKKLINFRTHLLKNKLSSNTIKTYFTNIKTIYTHFEIELPHLPSIKYEKNYQTNYRDLPTRKNIKDALKISPLPLQALILFMSSSGTAKAETLSLTVEDFLKATEEYYNSKNIKEALNELSHKKGVVPTFYLKRIKTNKYYYTFCSPEATEYIIKYLLTRKNLKKTDKLFPFSNSYITNKFKEINDKMEWGFRGNYRFFRTHTLRKFHASNIQLSQEHIDELQGRGKDYVHETYIKTNPQKLKEMYTKNMKHVMIYTKPEKTEEIKEDIYITINVFVSDEQINLY